MYEGFTEEDPVEAVLLGPVGLGIPVPLVIRQVLGHRRIGVEPYLGQAKAVGAFFGQGQQPCPDPASLGGGQNGQVLQQQVAGLGNQNDEARPIAVLDSLRFGEIVPAEASAKAGDSEAAANRRILDGVQASLPASR